MFWNANAHATRRLYQDPPVAVVRRPAFYDFGLSCEVDGAELIQSTFGPVPIFTNDISDDGKVMIARRHVLQSGFHG